MHSTRQVLVGVLFLGCATTASRSLPDQTADVRAIQASHQAFIAAVNAADLDRAFSFLTEDFAGLVERQPTLTKAAYRALLAGFLAANRADYKFAVDDYALAGGWAYERLRYWGTQVPRSGGAATQVSWRAIAIWRRDVDGQWRVARYIRTPDPAP
jgi:ketosteroid isomerase-like protein